MMHFFVKSIEPTSNTVFEAAAILGYRLQALDYLAGLYKDKKLGFYFRSSDGAISFELHRVDSLKNLDARLKSNPQWAYCTHDVVPVTKTGEMVRELAQFLNIDPNTFFDSVLAEYESLGIFSAQSTSNARSRLATFNGDYIALMSADEEEIDEAGTYTVVAKSTKGTSATVSNDQLSEMWARTLRSQVAHLNSDTEFVDYNPVGRSEGLLVGKGDVNLLKSHIESTEIYPDTVVQYISVNTPSIAAQKTADELRLIKRSPPPLNFFTV